MGRESSPYGKKHMILSDQLDPIMDSSNGTPITDQVFVETNQHSSLSAKLWVQGQPYLTHAASLMHRSF